MWGHCSRSKLCPFHVWICSPNPIISLSYPVHSTLADCVQGKHINFKYTHTLLPVLWLPLLTSCLCCFLDTLQRLATLTSSSVTWLAAIMTSVTTCVTLHLQLCPFQPSCILYLHLLTSCPTLLFFADGQGVCFPMQQTLKHGNVTTFGLCLACWRLLYLLFSLCVCSLRPKRSIRNAMQHVCYIYRLWTWHSRSFLHLLTFPFAHQLDFRRRFRCMQLLRYVLLLYWTRTR